MSKVDFFDWQLDCRHPVSLQKITKQQVLYDQRIDIHRAVHLIVVNYGIHSGKYGNCDLHIPAGEIFLSAPWEPHCSLPSQGKSMLLINIAPEAIQNFFFTGYEKIEQLFAMPPDERMTWLNRIPGKQHAINAVNSAADAPDSPEKELHLWHAVLAFLIACPVLPQAEYSYFTGSRRFSVVLQKLGKEPLPLEQAAKLCNLSVSRFSALFKENFCLSYARYERLFRLNGAAAALQQGSTLKEAAAEWGFCDKSHLARLLNNLNKKASDS